MAKIDQKTVRETNIKAVFSYIASQKSVTKRKISNELRLNFATVSKIVDGLVDDGFVYLQEVGASSGGRKPNIYRFEPGSRVIIAIDFSPDIGAHLYLLDLKKQIISGSTLELANDESIDYILERLTAEADALCAEHGIPDDHILGVGVALPALYNPEKDVVINCLKPYLMGIHITQLLAASMHKPIIVENDANMAAFGYYATHSLANKHLLLLNFTDGIGLGLIINADIFYGSHGFAGEVGNMLFGHASRDQLFRFEDVATLFEIIRLCKEKDLIDPTLSNSESIAAIANLGPDDPHAQEVFNDIGEIIGTALSALVDLFDPDKIILSGNIIVFKERLTPPITQKLKEISFVARHTETEIEFVTNLSKYIAIGCGEKVIQSWIHRWSPSAHP